MAGIEPALPHYECGALPVELHQQMYLVIWRFCDLVIEIAPMTLSRGLNALQITQPEARGAKSRNRQITKYKRPPWESNPHPSD